MTVQSLVFFGKGGIGKSTIAANVSAALAAAGRRVLHAGCDPKCDSTVALFGGRLIEPLLDRVERVRDARAEDIVTRSHLGIDCVEAGGPAAGVGCGGRSISRMLEIFGETRLLERDRYDVVVFDVLGDVVCGGFAAPLRRGVGDKVVIVTSEEVMSIYAANNVASAVVRFADNGIGLAGLVVNVRDGGDVALVDRFASTIGTRVLATIPRDAAIREAEYRRMTVLEHAPRAPAAEALRALAEQLVAIETSSLPVPRPLSAAELYERASTRFVPPAGCVESARAAPAPGCNGRAPRNGAPPAPPAGSLAREGRGSSGGSASLRGDVEAGADAIGVLDRILGLPGPFGPKGGASISSATVFADDRLVVRIDGGATGRVSVWMAPSEIAPSFAQMPWGSLWYDADPPLPAHRELAEHLAQRLWRIPVGLLVRGVRADPGAKPGSLAALDRPDSLYRSYAHGESWRSFVEGHNFFRGIGHGRLAGNVLQVHHADIECDQSGPPGQGQPLHFFSHFLPEYADAPALRDDERPTGLTTEPNDREMVAGATAKLDAMLDRAAAMGRPAKLGVILSSCFAKVTGDDFAGVGERFGCKLGVPMLDLGTPDSPNSATTLELIRAAGFPPAERRAGSVNVVGLPAVEGSAKLLNLLAQGGVAINCRLLPDVSLAALAAFRAADAQVFYSWSWNERVYSVLEVESGVRAIRPPAPFGMKGSLEWLRAVAAAVGAEASMRSVLEREVERLAPRWSAACARASRHTLALVGDDGALARMADEARMLGIPLVHLLGEMGFAIEVLRCAPASSTAARCPIRGEGVTVRSVSSPESLEAALRDSAASCVYSEYFFDRRITRTGHAIFSLEQFAMGPEGAVRTAERLVRRAEMSFYRDHASRLGQAFPRAARS